MSDRTKKIRESLKAALNNLVDDPSLIDEVYDNIKNGGYGPDDGDDFAWTNEMFLKEGTVLDLVLNGEPKMAKALGGSAFTSMQSLTDQGRAASALMLPQNAGTRVRFIANLGSVLTYASVPDPNFGGTIVTVKTADGPRTDLDGRVFVSWDDGQFIPIMAEHLRLAGPSHRHANNVRMVVSSLGDISSLFSVVAGRGEELVHKATKDLWSVSQKGDNYIINRLFDDTGKPLKV